MKTLIIVLLISSFAGFVTGLAGKGIALNKGKLALNRMFNKLTAISLVVMVISAILWKFLFNN